MGEETRGGGAETEDLWQHGNCQMSGVLLCLEPDTAPWGWEVAERGWQSFGKGAVKAGRWSCGEIDEAVEMCDDGYPACREDKLCSISSMLVVQWSCGVGTRDRDGFGRVVHTWVGGGLRMRGLVDGWGRRLWGGRKRRTSGSMEIVNCGVLLCHEPDTAPWGGGAERGVAKLWEGGG